MRCKACDAELSDFESTRKSLVTKDYIDLCGSCYSTIKEYVTTNDNFQNYQGELDNNLETVTVDETNL